MGHQYWSLAENAASLDVSDLDSETQNKHNVHKCQSSLSIYLFWDKDSALKPEHQDDSQGISILNGEGQYWQSP